MPRSAWPRAQAPCCICCHALFALLLWLWGVSLRKLSAYMIHKMPSQCAGDSI